MVALFALPSLCCPLLSALCSLLYCPCAFGSFYPQPSQRIQTAAFDPRQPRVALVRCLGLGRAFRTRVGIGSPTQTVLHQPNSLWTRAAARVGAVAADRAGRILGTASLGNSHHLYQRWRGQFDAVLLLGERDSTIGVQKTPEGYRVTVLETDDQPELEDTAVTLPEADLITLPQHLWQDLDALLSLLGVNLEAKERAKWEKLS
jgi:hypothetical protein